MRGPAIVVYTTAPESYDYLCVCDTGLCVTSELGTEYRVLLSFDESRVLHFQLPRYGSGLYTAVLDGSPEAERIGLGLSVDKKLRPR